MRRSLGTIAGFFAGGIVGLGAIFAIGAAQKAGRAYPRYTVTSGGGALLITDNDAEKLFVYRTEVLLGGALAHRLGQVIDLSRVGAPELAPEEPKGK